MSAAMKCYRIDYTDFNGRPVVKVWRAKAQCYIRNKALNSPDCRSLGPVTEISEETFQRMAARQMPAKPTLKNRKLA